jgi:hypothetical protein
MKMLAGTAVALMLAGCGGKSHGGADNGPSPSPNGNGDCAAWQAEKDYWSAISSLTTKTTTADQFTTKSTTDTTTTNAVSDDKIELSQTSLDDKGTLTPGLTLDLSKDAICKTGETTEPGSASGSTGVLSLKKVDDQDGVSVTVPAGTFLAHYVREEGQQVKAFHEVYTTKWQGKFDVVVKDVFFADMTNTTKTTELVDIK